MALVPSHNATPERYIISEADIKAILRGGKAVTQTPPPTPPKPVTPILDRLTIQSVANGYIVHVHERNLRDGDYNPPKEQHVATSWRGLQMVLKKLCVTDKLRCGNQS
jgi:hypothetical protein